jgi:hypothetical protein
VGRPRSRVPCPQDVVDTGRGSRVQILRRPRRLRVGRPPRAAGMVVIDGTEQASRTPQRRDEIGRPVLPDVALGTGHGGSYRIDDFDDATLPAHRRVGQGAMGPCADNLRPRCRERPPPRAANSGRWTDLVVTSVRVAQVPAAPPLWAERAGADRARGRSAR